MTKPWFRIKRYGFGPGMPCAWQGWLLLFLLLATAPALNWLGFGPLLSLLTTAVVSLLVYLPIIAHRTAGPWRWRWGEAD